MKIYVNASHVDSFGNKIPDIEQVEQNFIVNKTYTVYTEDDIQLFIDDEYDFFSLDDFISAGLYKKGRGIVLPVGTQLIFSSKDYYFAFYKLPQYDNLEVGVSTDEWFNLRKHVKPL